MLFPSSLSLSITRFPSILRRRRRHHGIERGPPTSRDISLVIYFFFFLPLLSFSSREFISIYKFEDDLLLIFSLFSRGSSARAWRRRGKAHWRQISFDTFLLSLCSLNVRREREALFKKCCLSYFSYSLSSRIKRRQSAKLPLFSSFLEYFIFLCL